jgi:hypothetical protein
VDRTVGERDGDDAETDKDEKVIDGDALEGLTVSYWQTGWSSNTRGSTRAIGSALLESLQLELIPV